MIHRLSIQTRLLFHRNIFAQMGLLCAFWISGEVITWALNLPIPGAIIGMVLALLALASHKLSILSMKRGADWLIAEMLLFFVPAVLALLNHKEFIGLLGIKILVVILGGTFVVMSITALTIDLCYRWMLMRHVKH
ncbi:LrgA/CidA family [Bartonella apihabitans]|uniref:CidA/LrgA family protein n=2 Tax=Bartonellaceae TaxID=772 RepID=UPI0018DC13A1|nr:CidA/LrgA family protein [Bartonella sp. M0283]MBI0168398.1 CidA/LrgA family protein [Bartonella apihabitans]